MKGFLKFIFVFILILAASIVLAPLLFDFFPHVHLHFKFEKIFNRLVMIFSLTAIVLWIRKQKEIFSGIGFAWSASAKKWFLQSFIAGFVTLLGLTIIRLVSDFSFFSVPEKSWWSLTGAFFSALGAGLLIGVLEEFFFRGFIQNRILRIFRCGIPLAVIATNLFYASLHFVSKKKPFIGQDPDWHDSVRLMAAPFASWGDMGQYWPAFFGLFIFGVILSLLYLRTRSLWPSIGLHAGCVFFVKLDGLFIGIRGTPNLWMGTKWFYDGIMGWLFLIVLGAVLLRIIKTDSSTPMADAH